MELLSPGMQPVREATHICKMSALSDRDSLALVASIKLGADRMLPGMWTSMEKDSRRSIRLSLRVCHILSFNVGTDTSTTSQSTCLDIEVVAK